MNCLITAGPTYEPLDQVRRLTNFSTGSLGLGLAQYLHDRQHFVTVLLGETAVCQPHGALPDVRRFATTAHLSTQLQAISESGPRFDAVFHAAAVSDFTFGGVYSEGPSGKLRQETSGKFSTGGSRLLVELRPTPKLISNLRALFSSALIVGWKYEVDGEAPAAIEKARRQIVENSTDASVLNGPAVGAGFVLLTKAAPPLDLLDKPALFQALAHLIERERPLAD